MKNQIIFTVVAFFMAISSFTFAGSNTGNPPDCCKKKEACCAKKEACCAADVEPADCCEANLACCETAEACCDAHGKAGKSESKGFSLKNVFKGKSEKHAMACCKE